MMKPFAKGDRVRSKVGAFKTIKRGEIVSHPTQQLSLNILIDGGKSPQYFAACHFIHDDGDK